MKSPYVMLWEAHMVRGAALWQMSVMAEAFRPITVTMRALTASFEEAARNLAAAFKMLNG